MQSIIGTSFTIVIIAGLAQTLCGQQVNSTPKCGQISGGTARIQRRIYNGSPVKDGEAPFYVMLEFSDTSKRQTNYCGGVIIDQWHILTAIHCVRDEAAGNIVHNRTSIAYIGNRKLPEQGQKKYSNISVTKWFFREGSLKSKFEDTEDIAVGRLSHKLKFQLASGPDIISVNKICLPKRTARYKDGQAATVIGFGLLDRDIDPKLFKRPEKLQAGAVTLTDVEECRKILDQRKSAIVCSGLNNDQSAPRRGDSGSPLVTYVASSESYELVGIISAAMKEKSLVISTRVASYVDWINAIRMFGLARH